MKKNYRKTNLKQEAAFSSKISVKILLKSQRSTKKIRKTRHRSDLLQQITKEEKTEKEQIITCNQISTTDDHTQKQIAL